MQIVVELVMPGQFVELAPFSCSRTQVRRPWIYTSSTRICTVAPTRAKVNDINPIRARSRSPMTDVVSMDSSRSRASSLDNTDVFPFLTECLGPRTTEAGFQGRIWPLHQLIEEHTQRRQVLLYGRVGKDRRNSSRCAATCSGCSFPSRCRPCASYQAEKVCTAPR